MTVSAQHKREARLRRHRRVRKKVVGDAAGPRLAVFRSNKHISAQVIDDRTGRRIPSASSPEAGPRGRTPGNKDTAAKVGALLAERAKAAGVDQGDLDTGGTTTHGPVAAINTTEHHR